MQANAAANTANVPSCIPGLFSTPPCLAPNINVLHGWDGGVP